MAELMKRQLVRRGASIGPPPDRDGPLGQSQAALDAFASANKLRTPVTLADVDYPKLAAKIKLDKQRLDLATEEQAEVFLEIGERHAQAVSVRDLAKDTVTRVDAELARDKRIAAAKAGEKITEKITDDYVCLHEKHAAAVAAYADARRAEMKWSALRDAFDQRMRMIRELVGLYAAGYWTNSGTAGARGQVQEALAERARSEQQRQREQRG